MTEELRKYLAITLCFALIIGGFPPLGRAGVAPLGSEGQTVLARASYYPNGIRSEVRVPNRLNADVPSHRPRSRSHSSHQALGAITLLPGQTSTVLADGRYLVLGGEGKQGPLSAAAILDPITQALTELPQGLSHRRAWHTATTLPNGSVLVLGGIGSDGKIESSVEVFNPGSLTFGVANGTGLTPRAHHTATLLTDGRLLITGGVSAGNETLDSVEFFDFKTATRITGESFLRVARQGHTATLNPDGTVLLWGGSDKFGQALSYGEVFDPITNQFRVETTAFQNSVDAQNLSIKVAVPGDQDENVPVDAYIVLRFSHSIAVKSANTETLQLSGSEGIVGAKVVPAEGGMLAFVTPASPLATGAKYTLSIVGVHDSKANALPDSYISFTTAGTDPTKNAGTVPVGVGASGGGAAANGDPSAQKLPPLQAPAGVTALAGQALTLDGTPLKDVTLRVEDTSITAKTDGTGRFLLKGVSAGHHPMIIDGRTVNRAQEKFGVFEAGVDITSGKTNVLDYTIWMTALDEAHAVKVPFPTSSEVVVTTPTLPGLEFHIPPNTTITDTDGNVAPEISITPIPIKQPPFPLPKNVQVPIYFTIQPGGGYISVAGSSGPKGARLIYPNTYKAQPGTRYNFWNYDPDEKGWYVYGQGSVSSDSNSIAPDKGVEIYQLTGAMVASPGLAPPSGPGHGPADGEPIDLGTGLFIYNKTDLYLSDTIPIYITRTYRQDDVYPRAFGRGATHNYDIFLVGDTGSYTYQELILPDGGRVRFDRISSGTSFGDAVYQNTSSPGAYFGAKIAWNGGGWTLTTKTGTQLTFPDGSSATTPQQAALTAITDRYGNTVTLTRDSNHNLTSVTSPNGRFITLTYDGVNRIVQAQDNLGRVVQYIYDGPNYQWPYAGTLFQVIDVNGGLWKYYYDSGYCSSNNIPCPRMNVLTDPRGITYLQNQYDTHDRVVLQTLADNISTYQFSYTTDNNGNVVQTNVTDPRGNVRQVVFNPPPVSPSGFITGGYPASDTTAEGTAIAATTTYQQQPGTNLPTSTTDALGRITTITYDSLANATTVTRLSGTPNATATSITYDATFSNVTSITDPLGHTTQLSYDPKGNLTTVTDALGNSSTFTYNNSGQILTAMDSGGNTTQFLYSGGDLVSVVDPLGRTTNRFFDAAGRLISVTDPSGQTTSYKYNPLNQVTQITDALGGVTALAYDGNGNLTSFTDARNTSTSTLFTYDNMDRVLTRKDPLGNQECYGTVSGGACQANGYDGLDNLLQFTDRRGKVTTYSYDSLNRLSFIGYGTQTGPTYESTVTNTFDAGNRLTQVVDSLSGTITRGFNGLDRLTSETTPQGSVSYTYDAADRRQTMTVAGQPAINYTFDAADRLTQIIQGTSAVQFNYDGASRRARLTLPNGIVTTYSYDSASQLTGMNYSLGVTLLGNLTYAYDQNGRRNSVTGSFARTGIPNPISTTAYNANNQLTTWGTAGLFYDANGNMTSDGTHSYTWDARNHLKQIDSGSTASFSYDPFGRRVSKTVLGASTGFLYDVANPVQELSGTTPTANLLTGSLDEYFTRTDSSGARNFLADALGSTLSLTDTEGMLQTSYTYEPFGSTTVAGAASSNSFAYTGRELEATGLYFNRARYYSATLNRFTSEDPISFTNGANVYAYALNSPLIVRDPSGLFGAGVTMGYSFWGGIGGGSGAGGTASVGGIYFSDPSNPMGFDSSGFTTQGGFGGPSVGDWGNPTIGNMVGGIGSGVGIGPIITNAKSRDDFAGPFTTNTLTLPMVTLELSLGSGGIWSLSVQAGPGWGISFSHYCTNTWTNPISNESFSHPGGPGGKCGCNTGPGVPF